MAGIETSGPVALKDAQAYSPEHGLERQVLAFSSRLMLVRHVMQAGWKGARHSHPHEQLIYVVRGQMRFVSGDRQFVIRAGDSFVVPGGVEHEAAALEDSEVLDVFTPFREDYAGK